MCTNNLMMGIAPLRYQSSYFAIAGAIAGITGAIGITDVPLPTVHTDISPRGSQTEIKGNCWTDRETKSYSGYRPSEVRFQSY